MLEEKGNFWPPGAEFTSYDFFARLMFEPSTRLAPTFAKGDIVTHTSSLRLIEVVSAARTEGRSARRIEGIAVYAEVKRRVRALTALRPYAVQASSPERVAAGPADQASLVAAIARLHVPVVALLARINPAVTAQG